jgi:uncharacterized membrane protein YgcG
LGAQRAPKTGHFVRADALKNHFGTLPGTGPLTVCIGWPANKLSTRRYCASDITPVLFSGIIPSVRRFSFPSNLLGRKAASLPGPEEQNRGHSKELVLMGKKLYVGNLSFDVRDGDLEALFAQHGGVASAEVISDRDSGRSKGFGFVEMESEEAAQTAINALHDREYKGRNLTVNEARPKEDRPRGNSGGYGGGGYGGGGGGGYGGGGGRNKRRY